MFAPEADGATDANELAFPKHLPAVVPDDPFVDLVADAGLDGGREIELIFRARARRGYVAGNAAVRETRSCPTGIGVASQVEFSENCAATAPREANTAADIRRETRTRVDVVEQVHETRRARQLYGVGPRTSYVFARMTPGEIKRDRSVDS